MNTILNLLLRRLKNGLICCLTVVAAMSPVLGNCEDSTLPDEWHDEVLSATNRDGSAVKVVTRHYPKKDRRAMDVFFRAAPNRAMVSIGHFEQALSTAPPVGAQIIDWDKDGEHELEIVHLCGTGSNCERTIYRVDKEKPVLRQLFHAWGAEFELIDGHLVESERDSCCAWIASAHKFVRSRHWVNPEVSFSVLIQAGDKDTDPSTCTFYIDAPDEPKTINPPSKAFLKVCDHYGTGYVVTKPTKRVMQQ